MNIFFILLISIISYGIGSIQIGTLTSKIFYKIDVRDFGSKSSGATNINRVIGWKPGVVVLILDIFKGLIPILTTKSIFTDEIYSIIACSFLVLGHCFPVFHKFKGGKGIATGFGSVIVLVPYIFIGLPISLPIIYYTKFVSLGSIVGCLITIIIISLLVLIGPLSLEYLILLLIPLLIIFQHRGNIMRLVNKNENKIFDK